MNGANTVTAADNPLSRSLVSLAAYFDDHDHYPSPEHWAALRDIAQTMQDMADGVCTPKVKLSAVDPGAGKTQTVAHFARALTADATYEDVGMIICVGRIEEAKNLVADLDLPPGKVAVLTSDAGANALGCAIPTDAQVLITTQQRIEAQCKGASFAAAPQFHFRGRARQVRVWDEAWLPGTAMSISRDAMAALFQPLRARFPEMVGAIEDLFFRLKSVADDETLEVPDWQYVYGVGLHDALAAAGSSREDHRAAITGLFLLSGRMARVKHDGPTGNSMLTYEDTLPVDLVPLLVLDASGRVRNTYADIEQYRGTLDRLKSATKDYSPLSVHVWQTAGSKSGWQRRGAELADGVVQTILGKPDERWLVVAHKPSNRVMDLEREVRRELSDDMSGRVNFITWGQHMATNAYADVPNVILAGTLFMRTSFYTALTHLAQGVPPDKSAVPDTAVNRTIIGEHRNLLLQAICRGRVRKLDGDKCLPMDAYVIASPLSGIPGTLKTVFPNCQVHRWEPVDRPLTGRLRTAVDYVEQALAVGIGWLPLTTIRDAIGVSKQNFGREVTKRPEWLDAIASRGLETIRAKGGIIGLQLLADAEIEGDVA